MNENTRKLYEPKQMEYMKWAMERYGDHNVDGERLAFFLFFQVIYYAMFD